MVQYSVAAMLGLFGPTTVVRLMCHNPAQLYGIQRRGVIAPGMYADIARIRRVTPYTVHDADVVSRCAWTPLDGRTLRYRIIDTWLNGSRHGKQCHSNLHVDGNIRCSLTRLYHRPVAACPCRAVRRH